MAIKNGLMADPNQPTSLNQAITPVGTCTSMCPEFERVERIVQKMVDKSEKVLLIRPLFSVCRLKFTYVVYCSFFILRQILCSIWKRKCLSDSEDQLPATMNSFHLTFEPPRHFFKR